MDTRGCTRSTSILAIAAFSDGHFRKQTHRGRDWAPALHYFAWPYSQSLRMRSLDLTVARLHHLLHLHKGLGLLCIATNVSPLYYNHYHTEQVAIYRPTIVCNLVNALVFQGETPQLQVVEGG